MKARLLLPTLLISDFRRVLIRETASALIGGYADLAKLSGPRLRFRGSDRAASVKVDRIKRITEIMGETRETPVLRNDAAEFVAHLSFDAGGDSPCIFSQNR